MGLEEPPTTGGVPLYYTAKSNPPSVLVRWQESLKLHPYGVFIKDLQPPNKHQAHSFKEVTFVAFTAHPQGSKCFHTVLNLQENEVSSTSWNIAFTVLFY